MSASQCPYCLETFSNPYCLGPHTRRCRQRHYVGLSASDFSDDDNSADIENDDGDNDTNVETNNAETNVLPSGLMSIWQLAQRTKHVGARSSVASPPVGMIRYFPDLSADYQYLQNEWDRYTCSVSNLFEPTFWDTFDIVREEPGVCV